MNIKNKKGFTLIELLAVIVILIIILILAFSKTKNSSRKAKNDAIKANAINYVKMFKDLVGEDLVDSERLGDGVFKVQDLESYGLKVSGDKPDAGYFVVGGFEILNYCLQYGDYYITNVDEENPLKEGVCPVPISNAEFAYSGHEEVFNVVVPGNYKIELWGASGGRALCNGNLCGTAANGGYASGIVELAYNDVLYINVGGAGQNGKYRTNEVGGYNGGGSSTWDGGDDEAAGSGGGASDVRFQDNSLFARIMVAGGGGGSSYGYTSGYGGGLSGGAGNGSNAPGATQVSGYAFGIGKNGEGTGDSDGVAGGGGGYWGGTSYNNRNGESASGGSGYISGHRGCIAIKSSGDTTPRLDLSGNLCSSGTTDIICSYHYSGVKFTDTVIKSGNEEIPTHDGTSTMTGNNGNGYARITLIQY